MHFYKHCYFPSHRTNVLVVVLVAWCPNHKEHNLFLSPCHQSSETFLWNKKLVRKTGLLIFLRHLRLDGAKGNKASTSLFAQDVCCRTKFYKNIHLTIIIFAGNEFNIFPISFFCLHNITNFYIRYHMILCLAWSFLYLFGNFMQESWCHCW